MNSKKNKPMRLVKKETGLTSRQIRYYDENDLIFPERTSGNQRLFSKEDINRLKKIKDLIEKGYTIEAIKNKLKPPETTNENTFIFESEPWENRINKGDLSSKFPVINKYNKFKKFKK